MFASSDYVARNEFKEFLANTLRDYPCQCDVVANGKEAIEALHNITYDLVLMDCLMPEMNDYVSKPIAIADLSQIIETWIKTSAKAE